MANFALREVSSDFMMAASWKLQNTVELDASPAEIFAIFEVVTKKTYFYFLDVIFMLTRMFYLLKDGEKWKIWFEEIKGAQWKTPGPRCLGSVRTDQFSSFFGTIFGPITLQKSIVAFEQNSTLAFRIDSSDRLSFLFFRALIENYELKELPNGKTQFTHALYMEPSYFLWMMGWIVSSIIQSILSRAGKRLEANIANKILLNGVKLKQSKEASNKIKDDASVKWWVIYRFCYILCCN